MKTLAMAAALSLMALAFSHGPAHAQNLEALFAGSELYRTQGYGAPNVRYDRLDLAADGTFTGDVLIEHSLSSTSFDEELSISGRWRVVGDRLCLAEASTEPAAWGSGPARESCYALRRLGADNGYIVFRGTEVGTGLPWQFKVAPGDG